MRDGKKITVADIYRFIDSFAPFDTQESWDNSGLLVGEHDAEVHKIGVALEVTPEVLNSAAEQGIDLIVTHHPVIFIRSSPFCAGRYYGRQSGWI